MCLGHTHAISGAVTGLAAGVVLHQGTDGLLALSSFGACFATLPDLDSTGACAARSLGFVSEGFACAIEHVSGGHRHGTHSAVGVAVFTLDTWLACQHAEHTSDWVSRLPLILLLALALAAGLRALRVHSHLADVAAIGAAAAIAVHGWEIQLIPLACALGCATHLAGDMLTVEGIPIAWPLLRGHVGLPRPVGFTTGTWRETWVLAPTLLITLGWLAWIASGIHAVPVEFAVR
jgi:hypothetical protein